MLALAILAALALLAVACDDGGGERDDDTTDPSDTALADTSPADTSADTATDTDPADAPDGLEDTADTAETDTASDTTADTTADTTGDTEPDVPPVPPVLAWQAVDAAALPADRWGQIVAAMDADSGLVFGGVREAGVQADLWRVDVAADGTAAATAIPTTGAPPPRYCGCMAYDPTRAELLLVGGRDFNAFFAETWRLDLLQRTWERLDLPAGPSAPIGCAMTYSAAADAYLLFGGGSQSGTSDALWRFDPDAGTWSPIPNDGMPAPSNRYDAVLLPLDPTGATLLLHGGSASGQSGFLADVWLLDAASGAWSAVSTAASAELPPGRRTPWAVLVGDGHFLVSGFGVAGLQPGAALGDLWMLELATGVWQPLELGPDAPTARGYALALPAGSAGAGLLMGGYDLTTLPADAWLLTLDAP